MEKKNRVSFLKFLIFELVTMIILVLISKLLESIAGGLLYTTGHKALTSGDIPFLFTCWQGWVIIIISFFVLLFYTLFDVNAVIIMSDNELNNKGKSMWAVIKEAFASIRFFGHPTGVFLVIYISLLAPLCGAGAGISLTEGFAIPDFIMLVIRKNTLIYIFYIIGMIALLIFGIVHTFIFHVIVLEKKKSKDAFPKALNLFKHNVGPFLGNYILIILKIALILAIVFVCAFIIPFAIISATGNGTDVAHYFYIAFSVAGLVAVSVAYMLIKPIFILDVTKLYRRFNTKEEMGPEASKEDVKRAVAALPTVKVTPGKGFWIVMAIALGVVFIISGPMTPYFDKLFTRQASTKVIAHRGAGDLAPENSVESIRYAKETLGAAGSEIDVQRTEDGKYVINHDATFKRTCGVDTTPADETLAEAKEFKIRNDAQIGGAPGTVASLEDIYDEAKKCGAIILVELKGVSADDKMAEDAYQMAKEKGVLDQCVFFSLKYDLLDKLETNHPDAKTSYCCFVLEGDFSSLNVDILGLEEQIATPENISKTLDAGKEVAVWTCNSLNSIMKFASYDVSYVITDNVKMAADYVNLMGSDSEAVTVLRGLCSLLNLL